MIILKKGKMSHPSGRRNALNDMSGSEWAQSSSSVMQYPDQRSEKQRLHGASFPQSLAEHYIQIYTKRGETVLDPFVGVGTTLDACMATGRNGIGLEISPKFVKLAERDLVQASLTGTSQKIICDDARNLLRHVEPGSMNFLITSPPYADMLKKIQRQFLYKWKPYGFRPVDNTRPYSTDPRDMGNLEYEECLAALEGVLRDTYEVVKPDSYAAWIVKDFRDLKDGHPYVNFHGDVINRAIKCGWILWDIRVFDQTKFRPLVVLGIPSRNFYLNIGHSYILTFRKR